MTATSPMDGTILRPGQEPSPGPTGVRGVLVVLARRWPTALALVAATVMVAGSSSDETVGRLAEILIVLPLLYLVVSTLRRPRMTWLVLVVVGVTTSVPSALGWADRPVVLVAAALAATLWGGAHGRFGDGSYFTVQVVGMVAFAAVALLAMAVDPVASRYLVAAGWLAHGAWDFVHLRRGRVVSRSYAEWCGVVDVLVAVQLVALPLLA